MNIIVLPSIIVPLSACALQQLDYGKENPHELAILNLTRNQVNELFSCGFFDRVNLILDINIDDFEDEEITDMRKLVIFRNFLRDYIKDNPQKIYHDLYDLILVAIEKETGIFFFF